MPELTDERKAELKAEANKKLDFVQREYWRVRNGKQRYLRCPYCKAGDVMRRNFFGCPSFCCETFARALKAILDRQDEVDKAANAARRACALVNAAHQADNARNN